MEETPQGVEFIEDFKPTFITDILVQHILINTCLVEKVVIQ